MFFCKGYGIFLQTAANVLTVTGSHLKEHTHLEQWSWLQKSENTSVQQISCKMNSTPRSLVLKGKSAITSSHFPQMIPSLHAATHPRTFKGHAYLRLQWLPEIKPLLKMRSDPQEHRVVTFLTLIITAAGNTFNGKESVMFNKQLLFTLCYPGQFTLGDSSWFVLVLLVFPL